MARKRRYTSGERRAYWTGFGFHAAQSLGMTSQQVYRALNDKEREAFVNGRTDAENVSHKFVPDHLARGGRPRRRSWR